MEAFEEIVKDHLPKIYYFLRRMGLEHEDADELVQDVFILLWGDLKSGHGLGEVNLRLYQHAMKKALNFLNKSGDAPLADNSIAGKLVFVLKHHEGFDFGDISEMISVPIGDVRTSFKAALDMGSR